MTDTSSEPKKGDIFQLAPTLDLRAAIGLASGILSLRGEQVTLDASQVKKIGAQCLQILLSARQTWERDGSSFALINPSDEFVEAVRLAGLSADSLIEKEILG